ncbi:MAG: hypothetical protein IH861_00580 [Chloroflexi bacterium]|nr:hypothetical protein [Chloroflexota bacterium]
MNMNDSDASQQAEPRAIVLGIEHPRAVAVARSLGRAGITVDAVDHESSARGFYSRYLRNKHIVDEDYESTLAFLESIGQEGGLLIPTNDHYLIFAAKYFDRLSRYFTMTCPPWSVLEKLMDKPQAYGIAREAGIKTPLFFAPNDIEELEQTVSEFDFENRSYILKTKLWSSGPADIRTGRFSKDAGPDATSMLESCREIQARIGTLPVIEEIIPGESDTCIGVSMVVNKNHEPVVSYCVRRLKLFLYSRSGFTHPYELGANVYSESIHDEEAVEAATRFVRQAKFYGLITVEFRRDATDGRLNLIKIDPRPVRATSLSTALGLDTPTALYQVFTGGQVNVAKSYPDGVAWIWLTWYLKALWRNRQYNSVRPGLLAVLRNLSNIKSFAYLSVRDPMPFLIEIFRQGREWVGAKPIRLKRKFFPSRSGAV